MFKHANAHYVDYTETVYRIYAYSIHEQSHTVIRLPVHLSECQQVYFINDTATETMLESRIEEY